MGSALSEKILEYNEAIDLILGSVKRVEIERTGIVNAYGRTLAEEVCEGEVCIPAGTQIGPVEMGILASMPKPGVKVTRRIKIALITTGDEIIDVIEHPQAGKVRNVNRYSFVGSIFAAGCDLGRLIHVPNDPCAIKEAIKNASKYDAIIVTGGISEHMPAILGDIGEIKLQGVAVDPGSDITFATVSKKLVFGLPGNPVSALIAFEMFVRPALMSMIGRVMARRPLLRAILDGEVDHKEVATKFAFGRTSTDGCRLVVSPRDPVEQGLLHSMIGVNSIIMLEQTTGSAMPGQEVSIMLLDYTSISA